MELHGLPWDGAFVFHCANDGDGWPGFGFAVFQAGLGELDLVGIRLEGFAGVEGVIYQESNETNTSTSKPR